MKDLREREKKAYTKIEKRLVSSHIFLCKLKKTRRNSC